MRRSKFPSTLRRSRTRRGRRPMLARTPATREQQSSARQRATSGGAALEAQLRARLDAASPRAEETETTAAVDPALVEYNEKLAAYESAFGEHKKLVDDYWKNMRSTRARGEFVTEQPPPKYSGPAKPVHPHATAPEPPPPPPSTIPKKDTFVNAAREVYGFVPEQAAEGDFKKAYAKEAIAAGLSAEQVAKVYAFETGGDGKFDLQPIRKDGTAISTALGYAQLLNANSVVMMAKHGEKFAQELEAAGKPEKAAIVRRMQADAKAVPEGDWDAYQAFAKTQPGRAMHAANLDVDIGPKMQMNKVKGIIEAARAAGHESLTPSQLELLNLAGEKNGLLMLKPDHSELPTANFFDRAGYDANPVVHQRTSSTLLARIDELMTKNVTKPGAQELLAAFESVRAS
jgi:hypothetical protein